MNYLNVTVQYNDGTTPMAISPSSSTGSEGSPRYIDRLRGEATTIWAEAATINLEAIDIFTEAVDLELEAKEIQNSTQAVYARLNMPQPHATVSFTRESNPQEMIDRQAIAEQPHQPATSTALAQQLRASACIYRGEQVELRKQAVRRRDAAKNIRKEMAKRHRDALGVLAASM